MPAPEAARNFLRFTFRVYRASDAPNGDARTVFLFCLAAAQAPGSVVVFGTPGEEMMPPKRQNGESDGVFNNTDVLLHSYSSVATSRPRPGFGRCCMNIAPGGAATELQCEIYRIDDGSTAYVATHST